jgi:ATP-dependent Clp protease ATP-binding subunit ClpA
MKLRLRTPLAAIAYDLAADLEARELGPIQVRIGEVESFELRHRRDLPAAEIARLLKKITPFRPELITPIDLQDADAELCLTEEGWLTDREAALFCDSDALAATLTAQFAEVGVRVAQDNRSALDEDVLFHHEAPAFARQLLRWLLARHGVHVQERDNPAWADNLGIVARDPALAGRPWIERAAIRIRADDAQEGQRLHDRLTAQGFRCRDVEDLDPREADAEPIRLSCGAFTRKRAPTEHARLQVVLRDFLADTTVDSERYPLRVDEQGHDLDAAILLPLAACRAGKKRAYGGPHPERFAVTIHTDDPAALADLTKDLTGAGFDLVTVELAASILEAPEEVEEDGFPFALAGRLDGYRIRWGALGEAPALAERLSEMVRAHMQRLRVDPAFHLETARDFTDDDADVWIFFPMAGCNDGRLLAARTNPSRFKVKLHTPRPADWQDLAAELGGWGFASVEVVAQKPGPSEVHFGGAPRELIDRLIVAIRERTGVNLGVDKAWPDPDTDIYLFLPRREAAPAAVNAAEGTTWRQSPQRRTALGRLESYGRVLTDVPLAARGKTSRDQVFRKLIVALSKMKRRNVIIAGPPGTGKTALVYDLARRIQAQDASLPERLRDLDLFELSPTFLRSGASYVGQYEERVKGLLQVLQQNPRIVLFIDEIHSMFQSGRHERGPFTDANESFKGALAGGDITVIGCTTLEEYRHAIAADGALARRFELIVLDPPTREETIDILRTRRERLERHYAPLQIPDEMFTRAVELTEEYLSGRYQPDKSIQLLDQACAVCTTAQPPREELNEEALYEALESATGQKLVRRDTLTVEDVRRRLEERIIGQDEVMEKLAGAFVAGLGGWQTKGAPRGVYLFAGPTGVGKTETALALAQILGGGRDALIRIDCNTLLGGGESHAGTSQLLGIPPGYIGYVRGQGGLLSRIRDRPESVVLFDEFEKADREVGELLLQVIDHGRVEDAEGNSLDFRRAYLIFTTNAGVTYDAPPPFGFTPGAGKAAVGPVVNLEAVKAELRERIGLGEEFLGRITHFFAFQGLSGEVISRIVHSQLTDLAGPARRRKMELVWDAAVERHLAGQWQPRFGVRYLAAILRNRITEQLSVAEAQGQLHGVRVIRLRLLADSADATPAGSATCSREGETLVICLA